MTFIVLIVGLQIYCIVHAIRRRNSALWITALIFLPLAATIAYLIVEVLPEVQEHRHVRAARKKIVDTLDPERELRAAKEALRIADTVASRLRVADALTALGRHQEALPLYQRSVGNNVDFRTGEKLARCLYLNDRSAEALGVIDGLPPVTARSDKDEIAFLRARVLEELGRHDEALGLYGDVSDRMPGDEARCRFAALLLKTGRRKRAKLVLEEVEHRLRNFRPSAAEAPMYAWAMRELASLR